MKTIYAKQIDPNKADSPLYDELEMVSNLDLLKGMAIYKHFRLSDFSDPIFVDVIDILTKNIDIDDYVKDCMDDKKQNIKQNIKKIKELINLFGNSDCYADYRIICKALKLITKQEWSYITIYGKAPVDYNHFFYQKSDWTEKEIKIFEIEYFNLGSEWTIYDDDDEPIDNIYCYNTELNAQEIKQEIRGALGVDDDTNIVLYAFDGYETKEKYEKL